MRFTVIYKIITPPFWDLIFWATIDLHSDGLFKDLT
jgi:hypothetical protein